MAKPINLEVENNEGYPSTSRYKDDRFFKRTIKGIGIRVETDPWTPPSIEPDATDLVTKVKAGEEGRLDLISARVYRTDSLWWLLAYFNDIEDPFEEVAAGMEIRYPNFDRVAANVLS